MKPRVNPHLNEVLGCGPLLRQPGTQFMDPRDAEQAPVAAPRVQPSAREMIAGTPLEDVFIPWDGPWVQPCHFVSTEVHLPAAEHHRSQPALLQGRVAALPPVEEFRTAPIVWTTNEKSLH